MSSRNEYHRRRVSGLLGVCVLVAVGCATELSKKQGETKPTAASAPAAAPPAATAPPVKEDVTPEKLATEPALRFRFQYGFTIEGVPEGAKTARVWVPAPTQDAVQSAKLLAVSAPVEATPTQESRFGNRMLYFETPVRADAPLRWQIAWEITRRQWQSPRAQPLEAGERAKYLGADRLIPLDGPVAQVASEVELGDRPTFDKALHRIYAFTLNRMRYDKSGAGWGRGDAVWACSSRHGNCSDFHSVFIGLCRVHKLPAKFEMGFPLDYTAAAGDIGGYHCWAKAYDSDSGWWAVDISEADKNPALTDYFCGRLHARRVHFTTGRDIDLAPKQAGPTLNFFIYPHVEIDGAPHGSMTKKFAYDGLTVLPEAAN